MTTIKSRIARGVALLDTEKPGWREKIDCETLDLSDRCNCVLGQLYGVYAAGLHELTDTSHITFGQTHGFAVETSITKTIPIRWRRLTTAWKRELDCEE